MVDNYNIGIAFLRIWMSFEVILAHYWSVSDIKKVPWYLLPFESTRVLAVPVFMIISFYFVEKDFVVCDSSRIKRRFKRLLIPHCVCGGGYFLLFSVTDSIIGTNWIENGLSDLLRQILTGSVLCLCPQLWYLEVLVILTAFFFFLFYYFPKNIAIFLIYVLGIGAIYIQYNGINYSLFSGLPDDIKYVAGRISEMLPFAGIGFGMAYYKIGLRKTGNAMGIVLGACLMLGLIYSVDIFSSLSMGFFYQGVFYIIAASMIVIIFMMLPLKGIPIVLRKTVVWISRYCFSIFCVHWAVGKYFDFWLENNGLEIKTFKECILIMVVSLLLSICLERLSNFCCKERYLFNQLKDKK